MADNPWIGRRVLAFAHQGGAREAPSSTMYALRRAAALGADALELDVHRSADGHLVVCHDATVDRTTDGTGRIAELTLSQLQALDAGVPVPDQVRVHAAVQVPPRFGGVDVVTTAAVHAAHDAGMAVHVWTIDDKAEMRRLIELGVDGVMTDRPSVLVALLDDLGLRWRR